MTAIARVVPLISQDAHSRHPLLPVTAVGVRVLQQTLEPVQRVAVTRPQRQRWRRDPRVTDRDAIRANLSDDPDRLRRVRVRHADPELGLTGRRSRA